MAESLLPSCGNHGIAAHGEANPSDSVNGKKQVMLHLLKRPRILAAVYGVTIEQTLSFSPSLFPDRYGLRWVAASGYILGAAVYAGLAFVDHSGNFQIALFCILLVILGLCLRPG